MKRLLCIALWAAAPLLAVHRTAAAAIRPTVIELFTSEGCSSCPPAELYTAELAQRPDVLALTFHVDYWDHLGWSDRFALPRATQRQRDYAQALHLPSVFTPQTVIDGTASFVGSDRRGIGSALAARREGPPIGLSMRDGEIAIRVPAGQSATPGNILLVAFRRSAVTSIGRGENSGRTIQEVNIVRSLRPLGRWQGRDVEFHLRGDSLPADSTDVAVLIQEDASSAIVGAASMMLRPDLGT